MVHPHRPSSLKRSGFTLLELVVVMFILMALAAIIVPLFPSMVERAHRASQATNESEITKAVQLYQGLYGNYPDGYDLLTDGTAIINYLPANNTASPMVYGETPGMYAGGNVASPTFTFPCGGYVYGGALTAGGLAALNGAGILNEYPVANGATLQGSASVNPNYTGTLGWQPTFNPYQSDTPTAIPLATGTQVVYVNPTGVQVSGLGSPSIINPKSTTQFIMFGLGKRCSMIGTAMTNAGSNFPNDAVHENPNVVYQRFGLIFQVEDAGGTPLPSAVCLGAVAIEANILLATDGTMASYSQNVPQISSPNSGPGE
jgi:type II secretory pathway pseudopilin PulG